MQSIHAHIEERERKNLAFLQSLVRIATVNPPGEHYRECVGVLEAHLQSLGMKTRIVRIPDAVVARVLPDSAGFPRYNLIGRWDVGAPKTLHFNAHYDVVPVSGAWKHGPFNPVIKDGWIHGRGTSDMKGAIAALCAALRAVKDCGVTPKVNIEVSFTADEEVGGQLGAGYIVRQGLVKPDFAIECEGGQKNSIGYGHNGVLWFRVTMNGKAAHAALPHKGINAFEGAAAVVSALQPLKKVLARRTFQPFGGKAMHPTLNIGGVFGIGPGPKVNTVPAQAWFTIDRRIVPNEKLRDAERELLTALKAAQRHSPKVKMDIEVFQRIDPCVSEPDGSESRKAGEQESRKGGQTPGAGFHGQFAQAVRAVRGRKPKWSVGVGFTDLHWYTHDLGLPGLGYGPEGEGAHGVNEKAKLADLVTTAKVYATFMENFDGKGG